MNEWVTGQLAGRTWMLYPLMLFLLPNAFTLGPFAPETAFALAHFCLFGATLLLVAPATDLLALTRRVPLAARLFGVLVVVLFAVKAGPAAALRAATWLVVLATTSIAFADEHRFAQLMRIWLWMAALTAGSVMLLHGVPFPPRIDFLSWTHRTGFGYFLAIGVLAGIVLLRTGRVRHRLPHTAALVLALAGLAATMSRGPWLLALLAVAALDRRARTGALLGLVLVAAIAVMLVPDALLMDVSTRFRSIYDWDVGSSSLYRANLYRAALDSLPQTWIAGAPTAQFGPFLAAHALVRYPAFFGAGFQTDSDIIDLLLLGGLPLLAVATWTLVSAARQSLHESPDDGSLVALRRAVLASIVLQILLDNVFSSALGWFMLGLVMRDAPVRGGRT